MRVRMSTFEITEQDRRAIRFARDRRKTMCSRDEAKEFIDEVVEKAVRDLRYRWHGPQVSEAVLNGADVDGLATHDDGPVLHGDDDAVGAAPAVAVG